MIQVFPKSRRIIGGNESINTTDNDSWALLNLSSRVDQFDSVKVANASTSFIENKVLSLAATGKNVDLVCHDGGEGVAISNHPDWFSEETGQTRFHDINWPQVTGTTSQYTQPANYYTDGAPTASKDHGTCTLSCAGGRRYGFAKEAALYSIGSHSGGSLWNINDAVRLVRLFHEGKQDKSRPTVYVATVLSGILSVNPTTSWVSTVPLGVGAVPTGVNVNLSTAQDRADAQRDHNVQVFTGTETGWTVSNNTYTNEINAAIASGVIVVLLAGNFGMSLLPPEHPDWNNTISVKLGANVNSQFIGHRQLHCQSPDAIVVGGFDSMYINEGGQLREVMTEGSSKGPVIDVLAPYFGIPAAGTETHQPRTGYVSYPDNSNFSAKLFGGTSGATPLVGGIVACLAELRPWMTSRDAKAAIRELATSGRIYEPQPNTLDNRRALLGSPNKYAYNFMINKSAE